VKVFVSKINWEDFKGRIQGHFGTDTLVCYSESETHHQFKDHPEEFMVELEIQEAKKDAG
jgi:hypothetical protein